MKRGRPIEQPTEVLEKFTRVVKHSDGSITTWFYDYTKTKNGPKRDRKASKTVINQNCV